MTMRNTIYSIVAGASMIFALATCDIEPADRFVELPDVEASRTVLLLDFTGQQCVNCPEAHEVMEELVKQYGDTALVTVSVHGGAMATSVKRTNFGTNNIGLMIEEGNQINDAFGITSWPMGVVDRYNAPGAAINSGEWAAAVRSAFETPTDVRLRCSATVNDSIIHIDTDIIADEDLEAAMQVWVVEDSIVTRQQTMQGRVNDYVHNNVLRAVLYPVKEGKKISLRKGVWGVDSTQIHTKYTDQERWNHKNLSIVAFVYKDTYVLNTIRVPVISE